MNSWPQGAASPLQSAVSRLSLTLKTGFAACPLHPAAAGWRDAISIECQNVVRQLTLEIAGNCKPLRYVRKILHRQSALHL